MTDRGTRTFRRPLRRNGGGDCRLALDLLKRGIDRPQKVRMRQSIVRIELLRRDQHGHDLQIGCVVTLNGLRAGTEFRGVVSGT
jgi:hypothetical protein